VLASAVASAGIAAARLNRHDQALAFDLRALQLMDSFGSKDHPSRATVLTALGQVHLARGRLEKAREALLEAERIYALRGDVRRSATLRALGDLAVREGRPAQAERQYRAALAAAQKGHPQGARGARHEWLALGAHALATGRNEEARAHLSRALHLFEQAEGEPRDLAGAQFLLARTLGPSSEGLALARAARQTLASAGPGQEQQRAELDRWLAVAARP